MDHPFSRLSTTTYCEKFQTGMPPLAGKAISDLFMWDEADKRLLAAVESGQPISDWGRFVRELREFYGPGE